MNDQRHGPSQHTIEPTKRDLPSVGGQRERQECADSLGKQSHDTPNKQPQGDEGTRRDHKPYGPVTQK
jgi:hypothetical protein